MVQRRQGGLARLLSCGRRRSPLQPRGRFPHLPGRQRAPGPRDAALSAREPPEPLQAPGQPLTPRWFAAFAVVLGALGIAGFSGSSWFCALRGGRRFTAEARDVREIYGSSRSIRSDE